MATVSRRSLTGEPYSQEMEITSISYDTRTLLPGALFVALPGAKTDGSLYIDEALAKGAAAVVCRRRPQREGVFFTTPDPRRLWPCWQQTGLAIPAGR